MDEEKKPVLFSRNRGTITVYNAERNNLIIKWLLNCYGYLLTIPFKKYTCSEYIKLIKETYDSPQSEQAIKYLEEM